MNLCVLYYQLRYYVTIQKVVSLNSDEFFGFFNRVNSSSDTMAVQ
jgi:hypothetical protein